MDLGISGRWAIVCAASKGLGLGCARALAQEGVNLVINARGDAALQAAATQLRQLAPGIEVRTVAGDISHPAVRQQVLAACPQVDILVNNAGGPPPGDFRDWQRDDWIRALDANMLTPIELIKACVDGMAEPEDIAECVVRGLADESFLILPHDTVQTYFQRKATDYDRWIKGMRRLQAQFGGDLE